MKYGFIARHRTVWPVRVTCRVMAVSASGYYDWAARSPSQRSQTNAHLTTRIRESFAASDRTYGSPRVWRDLQDWGEACSENRVGRLMQAAQLKARSKRRRLPGDSGQRPEHSIAANLLDRQFEDAEPNQRWVADFTYTLTAEGWLFVAVVLDLYSRLSVGWSMSSGITGRNWSLMPDQHFAGAALAAHCRNGLFAVRDGQVGLVHFDHALQAFMARPDHRTSETGAAWTRPSGSCPSRAPVAGPKR